MRKSEEGEKEELRYYDSIRYGTNHSGVQDVDTARRGNRLSV